MRHFSIRLVRVLAAGILLQAILPAHAESTDADLDDYINPDRPGIADGSNVVGAGLVAEIDAICFHDLGGGEYPGGGGYDETGRRIIAGQIGDRR